MHVSLPWQQPTFGPTEDGRRDLEEAGAGTLEKTRCPAFRFGCYLERARIEVILNPRNVLFSALGLFASYFVFVWAKGIRTSRGRGTAPDSRTSWAHPVVGFVTTFFDTLGIGNFATTTAWFKCFSLVPDELVPGTLNVGYTLPTVAQALIYITMVKVDIRTLALMISASVAGAWLGAGVVSGWSRRRIQLGMGMALLVAASLMLLTQLHAFPPGGDTLQLRGARLAFGLAGIFLLGALMTLGIGLYAPCMILVSVLGMNPTAAFPIMMGSCAFLMPVGSSRFIQKQSYSPPAALGLTLGGMPAVFLAAFIVRSLPLDVIRWLVVVVVLYTATRMLASAMGEGASERASSL